MRHYHRLQLVAFLIILGILFSISPQTVQADGVNDIGLPFGPCQTWYVWQGYKGVTHQNWYPGAPDNTYAFDLVINNWWDTTGTAGAEVIAAASGTVTTYYGGINHGWGVYIHLSDGNKIYNDHLMNLQVANNQWVNKGDPIGNVYNGQPGGVNHLHFQVGTNPQSLPLDFGVWNYPTPGPISSGGPSNSTGEYRGAEIKSSCDPIPPTTSHSLSGMVGENGWYRSTVQVTLNASDNPGGSGVKLIQYRIDGGGWQTYGGPFTVSGNGNHTVSYQAQDNAGNWESPKSTSFKIDATPPTNPTNANPGCTATNNTWQNSCNDPSFTWSGAGDATSGLAGYQYYWGTDPNGAAANWTTGLNYNPLAVTPGNYYLRIQTKDLAANWSSWATLFTFHYDNIAPAGSFSSSGLSYTVNPLLELNGSDAHSGVSKVRLSNDNTNWTEQAYAPQINWTLPANDGQEWTIYLRFVDAAGNLSPTYSQKICLDLTPVMPSSATYRLWSAGSIAGGGYASTNYRMYHTEGQPFARNPQVGSNYRLHSGFQATWPASPGTGPFMANGCAAGPPGDTKVYLPVVIKN